MLKDFEKKRKRVDQMTKEEYEMDRKNRQELQSDKNGGGTGRESCHTN